MDYIERLRRLAINDARGPAGKAPELDFEAVQLDQRTVALARLAALIAVGGEVPSYGTQTDAALAASATTSELVDVLVAIVPIVGWPRVVAAAPRLAMALGYDTEDDLETPPGS